MPVLEYNFNWKTLSAIAGLRAVNFYFRLYAGAVKSRRVVDFLQSPGAAYRSSVYPGLGPLACAPQWPDAGLPGQPARTHPGGMRQTSILANIFGFTGSSTSCPTSVREGAAGQARSSDSTTY